MTKKIEDDEDVIRDGEKLCVSVMLMDSMQRAVAGNVAVPVMHKPGYATLSDAQARDREATYSAYNTRVSQAWKNSGTVIRADAQTGDARLDAYARYQARVSRAWRHR